MQQSGKKSQYFEISPPSPAILKYFLRVCIEVMHDGFHLPSPVTSPNELKTFFNPFPNKPLFLQVCSTSFFFF